MWYLCPPTAVLTIIPEPVALVVAEPPPNVTKGVFGNSPVIDPVEKVVPLLAVPTADEDIANVVPFAVELNPILLLAILFAKLVAVAAAVDPVKK